MNDQLLKIVVIIILAVVVLYYGFQFMENLSFKRSQKKQDRLKRQSDINNNRRNLESVRDNFFDKLKFVCGDSRSTSYTFREYLKEDLQKMKAIDAELQKLGALDDRSGIIDPCEKEWKRLKDVERHNESVSKHGMMDPEHYGQIDQKFLAAAQAMTRQEAAVILDGCERAMEKSSLDALASIDAEKLLLTPWVFAMEKPYKADDFNRAAELCGWLFMHTPMDIYMARWYAQRQMGGSDAVQTGDIKECTDERLPSCLMWLQAYKQEQKLLQEMLSGNMPMSPKAQERLHALNNGGGNAPDTHQAVSTGDQLFFDVSALTWKEAEYNSLFENLAFQDKKLTYGLAVRDEDKDLMLPAGVSLPGKEALLAKFNADFNEEYGDQASARGVELVILSGNGEEHMEGILAASTECRQLGIAAHMARIGKKVNIKFYTLFLPEGLELAAQKQQALSLSRKLNPTVSMWESGLKTSMLTSIQQLLNSSVQGGGQPETPLPQSDTKPEEPVF